MLFGKYQFSTVFINDAILPPYKGSTFRGGFGHALKHGVCASPHQSCDQCMMAKQCLYVLLFEPKLLKNNLNDVRQMSTIPSPFVIEPPSTKKTHFTTSESFDFHLLLFGDNNKYLPYVIFAFDQMGKQGVGKYVDSHRGQFKLQTVNHRNTLVYSDEKMISDSIDNIETLTLDAFVKSPPNTHTIKMILDTPLRFKIERKLSKELTFENLIRVMLRRISFLLATYGSGNPNLNYTDIIQRAKAVKMSQNNLQWYNWSRYSARQDRKMNMGGLIGSVIYEGNLDEFMPLIHFCSKVHMGKQTSFGLGKIRCEKLN
ncbi:MAG: CRISPR system precrRNA processing endoribonuclease RAMP protein Cas6 [Candidatus Magnetomorum sp.]|nr:CRISPR system precrRNA processing endoribonuclease RAMP protein Cas6 [Candidatus Magnetomorum sp.]